MSSPPQTAAAPAWFLQFVIVVYETKRSFTVAHRGPNPSLDAVGRWNRLKQVLNSFVNGGESRMEDSHMLQMVHEGLLRIHDHLVEKNLRADTLPLYLRHVRTYIKGTVPLAPMRTFFAEHLQNVDIHHVQRNGTTENWVTQLVVTIKPLVPPSTHTGAALHQGDAQANG